MTHMYASPTGSPTCQEKKKKHYMICELDRLCNVQAAGECMRHVRTPERGRVQLHIHVPQPQPPHAVANSSCPY